MPGIPVNASPYDSFGNAFTTAFGNAGDSYLKGVTARASYEANMALAEHRQAEIARMNENAAAVQANYERLKVINPQAAEEYRYTHSLGQDPTKGVSGYQGYEGGEALRTGKDVYGNPMAPRTAAILTTGKVPGATDAVNAAELQQFQQNEIEKVRQKELLANQGSAANTAATNTTNLQINTDDNIALQQRQDTAPIPIAKEGGVSITPATATAHGATGNMLYGPGVGPDGKLPDTGPITGTGVEPSDIRTLERVAALIRSRQPVSEADLNYYRSARARYGEPSWKFEDFPMPGGGKATFRVQVPGHDVSIYPEVPPERSGMPGAAGAGAAGAAPPPPTLTAGGAYPNDIAAPPGAGPGTGGAGGPGGTAPIVPPSEGAPPLDPAAAAGLPPGSVQYGAVQPGANPTETQSKFIAYAMVLQNTIPPFKQLFTGPNPLRLNIVEQTFAAQAMAGGQDWFSELMRNISYEQLSPAMKTYTNLRSDISSQILRAESGAQITDPEWVRYAATLFPRPGDEKPEIDRKLARLDLALRVRWAGLDYWEMKKVLDGVRAAPPSPYAYGPLPSTGGAGGMASPAGGPAPAGGAPAGGAPAQRIKRLNPANGLFEDVPG